MRVWLLLVLLLGCDVSRPRRMRLDAGESCPTIASEVETSVIANVECASVFCSMTMSQRGCEVKLTTNCFQNSLIGSLAPDGTAKFEELGDGRICRGMVLDANPFLDLQCEPSCVIALYQPPAPLFESTEVRVVDADFVVPEKSMRRPLHLFEPLAGYLDGMVVLGDRIAVAANDDFRHVDCTGLPSRIAFVDRSTLAIEEVPGPDCLRALKQFGDGFLALFDGPSLGVFDREGGLVQSVSLQSPGLSLFPIDIAVQADRVHALVGSAYGSRLFALSTSSWTITASTSTVVDPLGSYLRHVVHDAGGTVVVSDLMGEQLAFFDPVSLKRTANLQFIGPRKISNDAGRILVFDDQLLVSTTGIAGGIWSFVDLPGGRSTLTFEREAVPWAMVRDGDDVLVGLVDLNLAAYIAVFVPPFTRFAPGMTEIGRGVVGDLAFDDDGDLWATLPWSGSIARIRRR